MEKKLCVALALSLVSLASAAGEIGRFKNTGGGAIVFTDVRCAEPNQHIVYAYHRDGSSPIKGCWIWANKEFIVQWSHGGHSIYNLDGFEIDPQFAARYAPDNKTEF